MPIGILTNSLSILLGGLLGAIFGKHIPERIRTTLPLIFGLSAMGLGVSSIMKVNAIPAVVLALILGTITGELLALEARITAGAQRLRKPLGKLFSSHHGQDETVFMEQLVAVFVLFCASATGIFGALTEGITGDATVLLTKSVLDLFTAMIFAATLGAVVAATFLPQLMISLALFFSASFVMPLTTPAMLQDFSACGGLILLATGFRIAGIRFFPIANLIPALVLVMPVSFLWEKLMAML
jgi:hypothetical protein